MVLSSSEILWLFEKHNLCPSNLDDDKVAGHGGAVQGAVAWAERRRVFLDRETSTSKGMEVDSRSTERRAAAQVGCRTGGAGMQRFPHWVEDSGQDLVDSGEWMKSLDQENRLIKVHLILELQTPHKPVRYHKRITWTGGGGVGVGRLWWPIHHMAPRRGQLPLSPGRSSYKNPGPVLLKYTFPTEIWIFMWKLNCNVDDSKGRLLLANTLQNTVPLRGWRAGGWGPSCAASGHSGTSAPFILLWHPSGYCPHRHDQRCDTGLSLCQRLSAAEDTCEVPGGGWGKSANHTPCRRAASPCTRVSGQCGSVFSTGYDPPRASVSATPFVNSYGGFDNTDRPHHMNVHIYFLWDCFPYLLFETVS